jgi:thiol-disulfide isomerase/thioredoxin
MLEGFVSSLTGKLGIQRQTGSDFKSGLLTGLMLGVIWSPCGGPILASIATLAATGMVNIQVILVTLAYVTGVGLPLFLFTYGGQRLVTKTRFISSYTGKVQQVFGVIMILTAVAIYFNYDKILQLKLLSVFPTIGLNGFEKSNIVRQQLDALKGKKTNVDDSNTNGLFNTNTPAPEFIGITKWLNSDNPLTLKELRGKVVLIDFWTYTCINCIRTLPHVTSWYEKYKDQGFVVIGVHTPEFEFEKKAENVLNAIQQYNIHYPVPQDNDYKTWNAYNNQYWPAEYLIDAKGNIRRTHFGEGEYDQTEMAIQALLKEAGQKVANGLEIMPDETPKSRNSPETYLGSDRMQYYYPNGNIDSGKQSFILSNNLSENSFSLGGNWNITNDRATAGENALLNYRFSANKVFLVLKPGSAKQGKIKVYLDNQVVDLTNEGEDVRDGIVTVDTDRLYTIINLHEKVGRHILKLEFQTPGVEAFAFTFG